MAEKTISELTPIATLSDDALFVAEQDGASGSVKASQLGIPPAGEDGDALISVGGKWQKQSGYGYNDKVAITWDGNTEGLESVTIGADTFYKVSDTVLTTDMIPDPLTGTMIRRGSTVAFSQPKRYWTDMSGMGWDIVDLILIVFGDPTKNGVWFLKSDIITVTEMVLSETTHTMSETLLPARLSLENGALMQGGVDVTNAVKAALGIT